MRRRVSPLSWAIQATLVGLVVLGAGLIGYNLNQPEKRRDPEHNYWTGAPIPWEIATGLVLCCLAGVGWKRVLRPPALRADEGSDADPDSK